MKKSLILLIAVVALFATSCSVSQRSMREPNIRLELVSEDFVVSEPVVGTATVVRVLGIDWARLFVSKSGSTNASIIGNILNMEDAYAIYDMMEKNPGYDVVMYPQVSKVTKGFPVIFMKTDITVTARLGKLKK